MDVDSLISELPQKIVDIIFSKLPIRDVVRSSILSKTWTNKWTLVTNISIDDFVARDPDEATYYGNEIIRFVDTFWSMHNGPIDKLDIYTGFFYVAKEVERRWLLTACQKDVKELSVEFNRYIFNAPPCIYSCKKLTRLELVGCDLMEPPPSFSGFPCMKHLILRHVSNIPYPMERLISSCPLLESLTLVHLGQPAKLTIRAPKLRCLDLEGEFEPINLENTPLLSCLTVALKLNPGSDRICVEKLLGSVPKLRRLRGYSNFTRPLSAGAADPCKFITYKLLKRIELYGVSFDDSKEVLVALRLTFSAPNLQELYIQGYSYLDESENRYLDYFNDPILADRMMNRLELVDISGVKCSPIFKKVVEFLLERSPSLIKMRISPSGFFMDEESRRLISSFQQASRRASIVIFDE